MFNEISKLMFLLNSIQLLKTRCLYCIFMSMIILRILYTFLIYLINSIISFSGIWSGSHSIVTAFIEILFDRLIEDIMLVSLEGGMGHILFKCHTFDELFLILEFRGGLNFVHECLIFLFDIIIVNIKSYYQSLINFLIEYFYDFLTKIKRVYWNPLFQL